MSSIPEFFSSAYYNPYPYDYNSELSRLPVPHVAAAAAGGGGGAAMWCGEEELTVPYFNYAAGANCGIIGLVDGFSSSSSPSSSSSSEKLAGVCDGVVPAIFSAEYKNIDVNNHYNHSIMDLRGVIAGPQNNFGGSLGFNNDNNIINVPHLDNNIIGFDHFGNECCCATSLLPEFKPVVSLVAGAQNSNLGMQSNQMHGIDQESNMMKVGRYSEEERKERIVRYLKKRNQRNFNKTIKYACRKTLADRRVRVRGRFARNNELICDHHDDHDQQLVAPKINGVDDPSIHKDMIRELCFDDALQIKYDDDEDWLQNFALCC